MSSTPCIMLFARWPEPGKAKTRLIPALGADGAAELHRRLTERTVETIRRSGVRLQVRSTGAHAASFLAWLGSDLDIVDQGDGDFGERLARAAMHSPVILLGTDGPDLQPHHLEAAEEGLRAHRAVIGPAEDGGYWLLGLAGPAPYLFVDMPWSTDVVFRFTVERLRTNGIEPLVLESLPDLDRPEDISRWPELLP